MAISTPERTSTPDEVRTPSVLVVLVVHDALPWLRDSLQALAAERYPRLGVVAVDTGSTDGSGDALEHALGPERVLHLDADANVAGAVRAALELQVAQAADYLLILHDDTALAPDAVTRMVEAAEGIHGVERVGVVGPKVVDWDNPRILREVGRSTDRFGHPYTPLQDGEMDQGQYDRVLEVLYVSSCAMLVSRAAWQRTGLLDERLAGRHDDLDFCWRARLAGFRVLMTPLAQARHRSAAGRGERAEPRRGHGRAYYAERTALASMLKNYGIPSLLWLLPLHVVFGVVRLVYLALSRRFEDAFELLTAWTWNLVHLPSTLRRRVRAQSVRTVRDRSVRRFMQSAMFRMPRWFQEAERILEEQIEEDRDQPALRARAASLAAEHPALVAWVLGIVAAALAYRGLIGSEPLQGGALAAFPAQPGDFFRELVSGVRTTGLGGAHAASPALAALGALSAVLAASTAVAQKVLLAALPVAAAVVVHRAALRQTADRVAAVVAASAYAVCAVVLWGFSHGRIDVLVALAVLPMAADRLELAFSADGPHVRWRFVVALGAIVAVGVAFEPGIVLPLAVVLAVQLLAGRRRVRGVAVAVAASVVAAALVFPILIDLVRSPGPSFGTTVGTTDFWRLTRLAPGDGAGTWPVAWFLPIAALLAFSVVDVEHRMRAWRAVVSALAALFLAWASAAGYLPAALSNAPMYIVLAAAAEALVLAYGLAAFGVGARRHAFGYRQLVIGLVGVVLVGGFAGQVLQMALGDWAVSPTGLPSAWPVVSESPGQFRVLWLGRPTPEPFVAPGGDPQGILDAGPGSVRFALTGRDGTTALDVGRGDEGQGYAYLRSALAELVAGNTSHAGAILAPLSVRFIVAESGDLPAAVTRRLAAQLDLDLIPAGGLVIYRNARDLPPAFVTSSTAFARAVPRTELSAPATAEVTDATPLHREGSGWAGTSEGGTGFVSWQRDAGWRVEQAGRSQGTSEAFGWAIGFGAGPGGVALVYADQVVRTVEVLVLGVLWLAVLWITRRPGSR